MRVLSPFGPKIASLKLSKYTIKKINTELNTKLGFDKSEYKLAGVLILFNNL